MTPDEVRRESDESPRWHRWLWFVLFWMAGVGMVGAIALTIRLALIG
ncbi:DUF2474 domain-containing protein [Jiella pacifica]|uniref:DUF2474 domain-containing protein n=1 Tax=Jiella pacifica TaxID=2696469 RepID=A0A6N9SWS1_9HYPH|nr:DUF2474 domain-containing protein [Jiella pacifica]NDW03540.1 DUF2474 domain-containing protein [Jiella pacifica]